MENDIDRQIKEAIRKISPEKPDRNIAAFVMQKIQQPEFEKVVVKQPESLISTKGWLIIFAVCATIIYFAFNLKTVDLPKINLFDEDYGFMADSFSLFLSNSFVTGIVVLAISFTVQVVVVSLRMGKTSPV